jgi:hypothetical protein
MDPGPKLCRDLAVRKLGRTGIDAHAIATFRPAMRSPGTELPVRSFRPAMRSRSTEPPLRSLTAFTPPPTLMVTVTT